MNLMKQFLVPTGKTVRLSDYDSAYTGEFENEETALKSIDDARGRLALLQDKLLAQETNALVLIFQGMDGAGKDGTIKHVMSSIDPQGCTVAQLPKPAGDDLKHDYLRRWIGQLPERGKIGIFNRSYYEEVIGMRVHKERLEEHNLPRDIRESKNLWKQRFRHINNLEQYLAENGFIIMKFYLNLSKEKQKERLLERLDVTEKKWKFSVNDIKARERWDDYIKAYEETFKFTATRYAPWYIIPADHRWFSAFSVADLVLRRLEQLKLRYPPVAADEKKERARARKMLEGE